MTAGKTVKIITRRKFMEEVKKKRSNLVMPTHYQELTREEMEYVDGGIKLDSKGLYFSYDDILTIVALVGSCSYSVAACMSASTSIICSTGIGAVIWGLFSLSSVYIAIKALSAASQGKGLRLSIEWTKIWFVKVPCGLSLDVV